MNTLEIIYNKNIKDFKTLFKKAKKQFLDYEKIEGINDWKNYDFSIDCSEDQMKFKDMLQIRFIEELCEASEALINKEKEHFLEEITDAINFFLSAYIMLNKSLNEMENPEKYLSKYKKYKLISFKKYSKLTYLIIHQVGLVCNLLKNRPWAQSNYLVSLIDFNKRLDDLWKIFWKYLGKLGIDKYSLFELFEKKYIVNQWRIKTCY